MIHFHLDDWFLAAEQMGDEVGVCFKIIENGKVIERLFHHVDVDGVGGFLKILDELGIDQKIPTSKFKKQTLNLKTFLKYLKENLPENVPWKKFDFSKVGKSSGVFHYIFSEQETSKIYERAKKEDVSLNTYLLWRFSKIVEEELLENPQTISWIVPVNIRGAIKRKKYMNQASAIKVQFEKDAGPKIIHQIIKSQLSQGLHWMSFAYMTWFARLASFPGMWLTILLYKWTKHQWVGSFSNIGKFENKNFNQYDFVFCPPTTRTYPVCVGLLEWNGRLSVGLQLHPGLDQDGKLTEKISKKFIKCCTV